MNKKQLVLYFVILLFIFDKGGLLPILPDYAQKLGAPPALIGYYRAFVFLALALGTFIAPVIARRIVDLRRVLILIGLIKIPIIFLQGQVSTVWQLMAVNGLDWFLAGIIVVLINICVGLQAGAHERGKLFGLIALAASIGEVAGGFMVSALISQVGYDRLFMVFALNAFFLLGATFLMAPVSAQTPRSSEAVTAQNPAIRVGVGGFVIAFLLAAVVARTAAFMGGFGQSVAMLAQGRTPSEIGLTKSP